MGSGEFGGGGSVRWQVRYETHEENPNGPGKPLRGHGKDKGPLTEVGKKLIVTCQNARVLQAPGSGLGTVIVEVTLADAQEQVVLKWGDEVDDNRLTQQS
jgi:hypothetical protein